MNRIDAQTTLNDRIGDEVVVHALDPTGRGLLSVHGELLHWSHQEHGSMVDLHVLSNVIQQLDGCYRIGDRGYLDLPDDDIEYSEFRPDPDRALAVGLDVRYPSGSLVRVVWVDGPSKFTLGAGR